MISDIVGALFWGVLFFASFPWLMIAMLGAAHSHHVDGRGGFVRDYYLRMLPIMPGAVVLYLTLFRTFQGRAGLLLWAAAIIIFMAGAVLFWLPQVRAAGDRLKAAMQAAATMKAQ
ncbi:hypothetical protein [Caulobacter sp. NIBR1757]|uniref:hypothetical protein n=1 Tax=Caulobacter sp. NIBR1757 TaxID=3016000 RepID=UPI0022F1311D|nr:hypothetical protein [Caulobacter sp. NIBR1757]WGM38730.1 hypothetical protein AMEJIAPC_01635 [Caulobacter sp. NIBR1757]